MLKRHKSGFSIFGAKMVPYDKPYLSFDDQLELLISRGMEVTDKATARDYLERIGYYRLSGYWYPLRKFEQYEDPQSKQTKWRRTDQFKPGSRFQDVVSLYVFDKNLRILLMDAIERLEVAVRVDIGYTLAVRDRFAQKNPSQLSRQFVNKVNPKTKETSYVTWLKKHDKLVADSREMFIDHFKRKYSSPLPIWISIELWDFGMLSTFYKGMMVPDQQKVARNFGVPDWQVMQSWLRTLNFARNVVAHHSRLWNKNLVDQPRLPRPGEMPMLDHIIGNAKMISRVYVVLCILIHFLNEICPRSTWKKRVIDHLHQFPNLPGLSLADMGFPPKWEELDIWKI